MKANEVKNETYEPRKLEAIYQNLLANHQAGRPQDYEIQLDSFTAVSRNDDPERFMSYSDFISPETKYVSVLLYRPNTHASDKYFFHLKPNQFYQPDQLQGLGTTNKTESEIELKEKWRKELHYEELIKENAELKKEIIDMEIIAHGMEDEMEEIKNRREMTMNGLGDAIWNGALNLPYVKDNFPMLSGLSGMNNQNPEQNSEPSTFKRKGQSQPQDVEAEERKVSKEESGYILLIDDLRKRVGDAGLIHVMRLLDLVSSNPQSIHFAIKQVSNFLKQKPNPTSDEKI